MPSLIPVRSWSLQGDEQSDLIGTLLTFPLIYLKTCKMDIFLILSPKYIIYVLQDICNKIEGENYMFIRI